jgi:hypothetical protein
VLPETNESNCYCCWSGAVTAVWKVCMSKYRHSTQSIQEENAM